MKIARSYGAKRVSKSQCRKHKMFGPALDIQMSFGMAGAKDSAPCEVKKIRRLYQFELQTALKHIPLRNPLQLYYTTQEHT